MTWPIMLCMHELALTRSEPGAKMNTIQPEPMRWKFSITSLRVSGRAAQRYPLWRVMHLKKYLSKRAIYHPE